MGESRTGVSPSTARLNYLTSRLGAKNPQLVHWALAEPVQWSCCDHLLLGGVGSADDLSYSPVVCRDAPTQAAVPCRVY